MRYAETTGAVSYILAQLERGGAALAWCCVLVGAGLVPVGMWLCFFSLGTSQGLDNGLEPGGAEVHYWPVMLVVSVVGVALLLFGIASLRSPLRKAQRVGEGTDSLRAKQTMPLVEQIATQALPFWVCRRCKLVRPGRTAVDACDRCGQGADFLRVELESDRSLAASLF